MPFTVKWVGFDSEFLKFFIGDFAHFFVKAFVESGPDGQAFGGSGVSNQLDDSGGINQGFAAPVLRDETEHFMFDLVPFTGARRKMRDMNDFANFVGKTL